MKKTVFVFSALIIALLILFQLSKYTYLSGNVSIEAIIGVVAIVFFLIGVYINKRKSSKNAAQPISADSKKVEEIGLSKREYEVLLHISKGLSNKEIAEKLFVSESTIKTHVSNVLGKLNAKRRTQALQRAKELEILSN